MQIDEMFENIARRVHEEHTAPPDTASTPAHEDILRACARGQDGDAWLFRECVRGQFCYDHAAARWHQWTEHFWQEDRLEEVLTALDKIIALYEQEAEQQITIRINAIKLNDKRQEALAAKRYTELLRKIAALQRRRYKLDVLALAAAGQHSLGVTGDEWDRDPWLLGCRTGVIDLRTGACRAGSPKDYLKTVAPTRWQDLHTPAPIWEQTLRDIFNQDHDLIAYLQRLFGYSITGVTDEDVFPILWGNGRNGKSTILETLQYVLGPLAGPVKAELLLDQGRTRSSNAPDADLLRLRSLRLVWTSETNEGKRLNVGRVKLLSGSDTLVGRPPYGRWEIQFRPRHKLFLLTNYKPHANADDYALWQRIHLIPFTMSFVDNPVAPHERRRNPALKTLLQAEAPGILAWLVRGCVAWQAHGLRPPETVKAATKAFQEEEDLIGQFIEERCRLSVGSRVTAGDLYKAYREWCEANGLYAVSATKFGTRLKTQVTWEKSSQIWYVGIQLSP